MNTPIAILRVSSVIWCLMSTNIAAAAIISISADQTLVGNRNVNLLINGSFETRLPGDPPISQGVCVSGVSGTRLVNCGTTENIPIPGWTFAGDPGSYAYWGSFGTPGPANGVAFIYFGNGNPVPSQAPTYGMNGVVTFPDPSMLTFTHPVAQHITNPTTISQTISGLIKGSTYLLDFYATGEGNGGNGCCSEPSTFGLRITGEPLTYLTTPSINSVFGTVSVRYHVVFTANDISETFEWDNWGHICSKCTELILDDVIVNSVPEPGTLILMLIGAAAIVLRLQPVSSKPME